ncbi:MAG: DUF58 domain-containing protein [Actinomycetota bacterium]
MTPIGRATIAAGGVVTLAGLVLGYPAVIAMGVTLLAAAGLAIILAGREAELSVTRQVIPERVVADGDAVSILTITNDGRRPFGSSVARERIAGRLSTIPIANLEPGETVTVQHDLPTSRRGIFDVGPLVVPRGDPIGLARRGTVGDDVGQLIVHPSSHEVSPFVARRRRDLEGAPSGEAAAGGVTFANLREYVPGDDIRLVHWKTSARTDQLLVRHNIDVHRPRTCVILDTNAALYRGDAFEDAVRVTASIVIAAIQRRFPYLIRTTDETAIQDPAPTLAVLDFLASLDVTEQPQANLATAAFNATRGNPGLSCAVVTGRAGVEDLQALGPLRTRFEQMAIIRVGTGQGAEIHELSGATLYNVSTSGHFAQAWNRRMRG